MTTTLRFVLIIVSMANCVWVLRRIRRAQVKIEDTVFWILFSAFLVLMSLFPKVVSWGAKILGVQSSVNFIFLAIIFVLILKVFRITMKVSVLESKVAAFAQSYAIKQMQDEAAEKKPLHDITKEKVSEEMSAAIRK